MMNKKFQHPAMAKAFKEAQEQHDTADLFELLEDYIKDNDYDIQYTETAEKSAEKLKRMEAWNFERYDTVKNIHQLLEKAKRMAQHYAETEKRPEYLAFDIKGILLETFTAMRANVIYFSNNAEIRLDIMKTQYVIIFSIIDNFLEI